MVPAPNLYRFSFLWHSAHFTGAALPLAFSAMWHVMHVPDFAVGLWNAAWYVVFIGAVATFVWQSEQAWFGALAGCCGLDAWWHVAQLLPA